ncbi:uncharacterized protein [Littorina saxatilis]|uniref:Uncharacterized protein n=1 Tax=Littorina saxatilis TaxID=31220 RepID=A0AAN9G811_9CAEN
MGDACIYLAHKQKRGIKAKPLKYLAVLMCVHFIPCSFTQPAAVREECVPSHGNACVPGASCQWTHSTFTCQCGKSSSVPMADRSACVVVIEDDFYFRFVTNIDCQVSMFCREYVPLSTLCVEVEDDISDSATRTVCVCDRGARVTSDRETCVMRTQATKTGGRHECSDDSDCPSSEKSVSVCVIDVQSYSSGKKHTACMESTEMSQLDFGIVVSRTPRHGWKRSSNATYLGNQTEQVGNQTEQMGNQTNGNNTHGIPDDNVDEEWEKKKKLFLYIGCGILGALLLLCICCLACKGAKKKDPMIAKKKEAKIAKKKEAKMNKDLIIVNFPGKQNGPSGHEKRRGTRKKRGATPKTEIIVIHQPSKGAETKQAKPRPGQKARPMAPPPPGQAAQPPEGRGSCCRCLGACCTCLCACCTALCIACTCTEKPKEDDALEPKPSEAPDEDGSDVDGDNDGDGDDDSDRDDNAGDDGDRDDNADDDSDVDNNDDVDDDFTDGSDNTSIPYSDSDNDPVIKTVFLY